MRTSEIKSPLCTVYGSLRNVHVQRRSEFKEVHTRLHTATVLYGALQSVLKFLRGGGESPGLPNHFDSEFDRILMRA